MLRPNSLDELVVARDEHGETVLGDSPESLRWVDPALVQDGVDTVIWKRERAGAHGRLRPGRRGEL